MFRQRLLTALVLLPLVLLAIYFAPSWLLAGILLSLVAASGWEWTKLIPLVTLERKLIFLLLLLGGIWCSSLWLDPWLKITILVWGFGLIAVLTYPASERYWGYSVLVGAVGLLFLSLFSSVFVALYHVEQGQNLIIYVLFLIWATDSGAYLVGKRWGHSKLIARVSPGKTIEGSIGGFLLASVVAIIGYFVFRPLSPFKWFLVAFLLILISMLGDLFISMLKRRSHVKDSGNILPGHGGLLDRLDSSIAVLPFFYYALSFLEFGH